MLNSTLRTVYWRLISSILTGILLCMLPVAVNSNANACADPNPRRFQGYSFLEPELGKRFDDAAPLLLDFPGMLRRYKQQEIKQAEDNTNEWRERICQKATPDDIYYLVYKASEGELEDLRSAMSSDRIPLNYLGPSMSQNSFARYLYNAGCLEIVEYLIYAKRCEPYAVQPTGWDKPQLAKTMMLRLIAEGRERFLRIESHYVRLRYAYQMIRLAHYAKEYQQVIELYNYLMPKIDNDPSIVEYWIWGHRAGALLALGKNIEAAYLYSKVFDKCPSKRESAYLSFHIKTDEEWKQCLLMCKSDHERATLYALRAQAEDSRLVEEMQKIYEYDPQNEFLEVLLIREIVQLEKDLLGLDFNEHRASNKRYHGRPRAIAGQQVIDLQTFVRKALKEKEINHQGLWKVAEGYLELLAGNYYFAERSFKLAGSMVEDDTLKHQLDIMNMALKIVAMPLPDTSSRNTLPAEEIADEVRRDKLFESNPKFQRFLNDRMAHLYELARRPGMAFICRYPVKALKANPELAILDDLLEVCRRKDRSRWEKWLVEKPDGTTLEKELIDIRATLLLADGQPEAALETLKGINRSEWDDYGVFNPFAERLRDCVRCPLPDTLVLYSKGELIETLLDMEYKAKATTNPDEGAELLYKLGVAYYNMSYFGYSWRAADLFRSGASLQRYKRGSRDFVFSNPAYPLGNRENMDCTLALYYFEKARVLARDAELAAKATFWAAKCEQKLHYINNPAGTTPDRQYFNLLRRYYGKTRFHALAVKECKYFQTYSSK